MGYKLADGSDSEQYKIGDEFEVLSGCYIGSTVKISQIMGNDPNPFFLFLDNNMRRIPWVDLKPRPTSGNDKPFTKSDLKDGMRVDFCNKDIAYVCGGLLSSPRNPFCASLDDFNTDLTSTRNAEFKIVRVTDRDGSVVFEREPEKRKITLELTDEQIESLKQQGIID